ncbi:MAG TPA: YbaN family protein [Thermohalobaculum sp.]|nr:YbaN family protein [Thermohalobaculum sp.]
MIGATKRTLWIITGLIFTGLGIVGLALPLMPGAVCLIVAAFCFAQGSPRLHDWLVNHRHLGPFIRDWRERRAISRPAKRAAIAGMGLSFVLTAALGVPPLALAALAAVLVASGIFVWTRPDGRA